MMSVLRYGIVSCRYFLNDPVDFKIVQCRLSNLRKGRVTVSNLRVKCPMKPRRGGRRGGGGGG